MRQGALKLGLENVRNIPWGEFKIEVSFFPRGLPGGTPRGVSPGRGPWGCSGELFGLPIISHLAKKSKDKTPGIFFHAAFDFDAPGPRNAAQKSTT